MAPQQEPTGRYRTESYCPHCHGETWHKRNRDGVWICNNCGHANDP